MLFESWFWCLSNLVIFWHLGETLTKWFLNSKKISTIEKKKKKKVNDFFIDFDYNYSLKNTGKTPFSLFLCFIRFGYSQFNLCYICVCSLHIPWNSLYRTFLKKKNSTCYAFHVIFFKLKNGMIEQILSYKIRN